jgi:hypothetical protein
MKKYHDHGEITRDYDGLVHPSGVFGRPSDVVSDPDLSLNEKRAVLAAWASDACAVEAAPAFRRTPMGRVVRFDEIMNALRTLDKEMAATQALPRQFSRTSRRNIRRPGLGGNGNHGASLH